MITRKQLDALIDKMVKEFSDIETALLNLIADYLKQGDIESVEEIYQWQLEHITNADNLTAVAVKIAETFRLHGLKNVKKEITDSGELISNDIDTELSNLTNKSVKTDSSVISKIMLKSLEKKLNKV